MLAPNSRIVRFGTWLRVKRNFYLFSIVGFGGPFWLFEIWLTADFASGAGWVAFLGLLSFLGAWAWGFLMWQFFASQYPSMRQVERNDDAT
jgi:hypothetical protein